MKINHITTVETSYCSPEERSAYLSPGSPMVPDGEYCCIRIPGLIALDDGSLISYCECRQNASDWSATDICMRKSTDGGRSWSNRKILAPGNGRNTQNNPVMFADGSTIHFLHCTNYCRMFYRRSTDGGETWSEPVELTESIDAQCGDFFWNCIAAGPGHGTVLSSGRLIVPVWLAYNRKDRFSHHPTYVSALYSDDHGKTWQLSPRLDGSDPNESLIAELPDGRLLMNLRNTAPEKFRYISFSSDGGDTWTEPVFDRNLPDPGCAAGLCMADDAILFSNCESQTGRVNLTLKKSTDGGKSWERLSIEPLAGYSDVVYSKARNKAYVLFEHANYQFIRCAEVEI